jgi:hypothetical protein
MTIGNERGDFIDAELFQLTVGAVTQRGSVYAPGLPEKARRPVHETLRQLLIDVSPQYEAGGMSDERHMENIEQLARTATTRHADLLCDGTFRIGSAQKALNLHLKYRWCLRQIPTPPHCPFDAYVLRAIPAWRARSWTRIESIGEYADLVAAARAVAAGQALAEWELSLYNAARRSR